MPFLAFLLFKFQISHTWRAFYLELTGALIRTYMVDADNHAVFGQDFIHDIAPFNYHHRFWAIDDFREFMGNHTRFVEPVEIKMVQVQIITTVINAPHRKCRAADGFGAAKSLGNTLDECCLSTAEIARQHDDFAAATGLT